MKLKNFNCDGTQNSNCYEIVVKLKSTNLDKTQKLKWGQQFYCDKTKIVTKLKTLKSDKTKKLNYNETQKVQM